MMSQIRTYSHPQSMVYYGCKSIVQRYACKSTTRFSLAVCSVCGRLFADSRGGLGYFGHSTANSFSLCSIAVQTLLSVVFRRISGFVCCFLLLYGKIKNFTDFLFKGLSHTLKVLSNLPSKSHLTRKRCSDVNTEYHIFHLNLFKTYFSDNFDSLNLFVKIFGG